MKKHEYLTNEDHYESSFVSKGRKDKICEHCKKLIPKGTKHEVHKFYDDDGGYPNYATHLMDPDTGDNVPKGKKTCSELFIESLN